MKSQYFREGGKRFLQIIVAFVTVISIIGTSMELFAAGTEIDIVVQTVLASQDEKFIDPRVSSLIKEMETVFRYTSYRLLRKDRIKLGIKETRTVVLEGNRSLNVTPLRIIGNRVELELMILKGAKRIFQTRIQLLNNSSIIVGGPSHGTNGVLIFSISSSF